MFNFTKRFSLVRDPVGKCQIGGKIPDELSIPENKCPGSFQYLGKISKDEKAFRWLKNDLHLICPIYMDFDSVWIDYSNPLSPQIINIEDVNSFSTAYDDLKSDSIIVYEAIKCSCVKYRGKEEDYLGLVGVPEWIQEEHIPLCPETGKKMKLLCQLTYQFPDKVKTKFTNIIVDDDWYMQYFQEMNFWGSGDLYIFYSVDSNIACYFIQNT